MTNTKNFLLCLFYNYFQTNEGFIEFRLIKKDAPIISVFCESLEKAASQEMLDSLTKQNNDGYNIYHGILPRVRKEGKEKDVEWITTLWADLDAKDYSGGKDEALQNVLSFPVKPSMVVDSGHGFHSYWFLHPEKISDVAKVKGIIKGIGKTMGADSVFDLSRILRLPGFYNQKHPEEKLLCKILDEHFHPEIRYSLSDFEKYWTESDVIKKVPHIGDISETMPERFRPLLVKNKKLSDTWYGRAIMPNNSTRSAYDMSIAVQLKNLYFTETEIAAIMRHSPSGKGLEATPQYLAHTIGKAVLW